MAAGLMAKLDAARDRVDELTGQRPKVVLCYEVGYDGFWLARLAEQRGIECLVMDTRRPGRIDFGLGMIALTIGATGFVPWKLEFNRQPNPSLRLGFVPEHPHVGFQFVADSSEHPQHAKGEILVDEKGDATGSVFLVQFMHLGLDGE